jgi:hypothetical protein
MPPEREIQPAASDPQSAVEYRVHQVSEDSDFFSSSGFEPARLRLRLPFFKDLDPADQDARVHYKRDKLEAFVNRDGVVKVAFFGAKREYS